MREEILLTIGRLNHHSAGLAMTQRKPGEANLDQQWVAADRPGSHDPHRFAGYETEIPKACRNPVRRQEIVDVTDHCLCAQSKLREPYRACIGVRRH